MLRRQPWLGKCLGCVGETGTSTSGSGSGSGSGKERRSSLYTGNQSSTHTHADAHGTSVGTHPLPPAPHQGTDLV